MSTLKIEALDSLDETKNVAIEYLHGGTAKAYFFYDQVAVAVSQTLNVSSVDDDAGGDFGVNLTSSMNAIEYSTAGTASNGGAGRIISNNGQTVGACEWRTLTDGGSYGDNDMAQGCVMGDLA